MSAKLAKEHLGVHKLYVSVQYQCHLVKLQGYNDELLAIQNKQIKAKDLYEKLGSDVTDYNRDSVVKAL